MKDLLWAILPYLQGLLLAVYLVALIFGVAYLVNSGVLS